jgi:hypothetical protein
VSQSEDLSYQLPTKDYYDAQTKNDEMGWGM